MTSSREINYEIEYADNGVIIRDIGCPWTEVVPFGEKDSTTPCANTFGRMIFEDIDELMGQDNDEEVMELTINLKIR